MTNTIDLPAIIKSMERRAETIRSAILNSRKLMKYLQPEMDMFDRREGNHNNYVVRIYLDHRNSVRNDEIELRDIEASLAALKDQN